MGGFVLKCSEQVLLYFLWIFMDIISNFLLLFVRVFIGKNGFLNPWVRENDFWSIDSLRDSKKMFYRKSINQKYHFKVMIFIVFFKFSRKRFLRFFFKFKYSDYNPTASFIRNMVSGKFCCEYLLSGWRGIG